MPRLCLLTRVFLRNLHCRSILTWLSRSCSSGICEKKWKEMKKSDIKHGSRSVVQICSKHLVTCRFQKRLWGFDIEFGLTVSLRNTDQWTLKVSCGVFFWKQTKLYIHKNTPILVNILKPASSASLLYSGAFLTNFGQSHVSSFPLLLVFMLS